VSGGDREVVVRDLSPGEAGAYVRLRREMLAEAPWAFASSEQDDVGCDEAFLVARLGERGQAIVGAFAGAELVGAAGLFLAKHRKMAHRARVWGVYVRPAYRGRGVARSVLERVIEVARTWEGVSSVGLSVSERAEAAARLYARLGFVAWGCEPDALRVEGRGYAEIHMVRAL